ncbi:hypothetical protein BLNAU_21693 [Blattamonas nauphoetae]|uniref:Uncharacterized protein n=1 Tax=Blattamonas nauphoetae TaxID=2049346 RepID=A0ABQ9WVN2_9EUKA|nr:hypothetical protein BLNAU_21693 [Blattamonas nauphoetae]
MLVPCGLDLEVFEWDSEKSVIGASTLLQLDTLAITKWTETEIVGQVDLKTSLLSLKSSLQWRARLVFGDNRTTVNSFLFASASSTGKGNMSQGGTASKMLWIIPVAVAALLAVGFLVMLVCFVRVRRDRKQKSDVLLSHQEMDAQNEADIEKVEIAADLLPNSTGPAHLCSKSIKSEFSDGSAEEMWTLKCETDQTGEMVDVIELDGKEHTTTKVRALTTLHSILHKENSLLHPQLIQRQVAFGLSHVLSTLQTKDALTQLTFLPNQCLPTPESGEVKPWVADPPEQTMRKQFVCSRIKKYPDKGLKGHSVGSTLERVVDKQKREELGLLFQKSPTGNKNWRKLRSPKGQCEVELHEDVLIEPPLLQHSNENAILIFPTVVWQI